ncbi:hypothetical protein JMF97_17400 [Micromonospora fiedleri]|uniref:Glycosyl hydrolases family 25 n=1 Tax=Micromonospora fiedleri TaxID=1157498 RepID=A0ABS1UNM1_9ACTN|nr:MULTISPECIES: hypothetical protein [Micromonospora]MBL6277933.1 hypothetical protein [Micromonospora fiedleri]WSK41048.1 hypothetical protein OG712_21345 [Micromonospora maris]
MTLYGWDASDYDVGRGLTTGRIRDARAAGISFMTYKGTEQSAAGTFHSQYYGVMLTAAKDAGIPFLGMYVVVHSQITAEKQATTAIDYADEHTPWWRDYDRFFWQIDLERWPTDDVPSTVGVAVARELSARTDRRVVMYASRGQYGSNELGSYPRWNANYPYQVAEDFKAAYARAGGDSGPGWIRYGRPELMPRIWQFTDSAIIGRQHTCDADAFRGTEADFAEMIGAQASEGEDDVIASFLTVPYRDQTLDTDDTFHAIRWESGTYHWTLPADGLTAVQATVDLRGLQLDDLVRVRAEYTEPGHPASETPLLTQELVSFNPDTAGGIFVVNTPNINVELPSGTEIRLQVAVRAGDGDTTRRVSYGDLTRVSMVLFRLPS